MNKRKERKTTTDVENCNIVVEWKRERESTHLFPVKSFDHWPSFSRLNEQSENEGQPERPGGDAEAEANVQQFVLGRTVGGVVGREEGAVAGAGDARLHHRLRHHPTVGDQAEGGAEVDEGRGEVEVVSPAVLTRRVVPRKGVVVIVVA